MTNKKNPVSLQMRIIHRYLGFFLAGIMAVYALSGMVLIFRKTNFLKSEVILEQQLEPNLTASDLGSKLKTEVKIEKQQGDVIYFKDGNYNQKTGASVIKKMELPFVLDKMVHLHKASTNSPLYFLNLFFGSALLFFVLSAFWMYVPKTSIFKKGLYFAIAGAVLTVILLFV